MQKQTKIGLLRALREQYIEEHMSKIFMTIQVEALVETAIAVGTASVVGKMKEKETVEAEEEEEAEEELGFLRRNVVRNMEAQTRFGLIRMKQQLMEDNLSHVFKNVPASVASTGRRFSWSHHTNSHGRDELESLRVRVAEAGLEDASYDL